MRSLGCTTITRKDAALTMGWLQAFRLHYVPLPASGDFTTQLTIFRLPFDLLCSFAPFCFLPLQDILTAGFKCKRCSLLHGGPFSRRLFQWLYRNILALLLP